MDLFIDCDYCGDTLHVGQAVKEDSYIDNKGREHLAQKLEICPHCGGIGKLVSHYKGCTYFYIYNKRKAHMLWDIISHKIPIPMSVWESYEQPCSKCRGTGITYTFCRPDKEHGIITDKIKTECSACHGKGYKTITPAQIYCDLFQQYLDAKKKRDFYKMAISNRLWEDEKYKNYKEYNSYGNAVCVRCANLLASQECCGCCNESMTNENGYSYFRPYNKAAQYWYNNGGYKNNICYEEFHDYTVHIF